VLDVCFFLFLILLFYGAGRAFLDLIGWRSDLLPFTLPSSVGITILTVAVTWFYQLGGSLELFFWITSIGVGVFSIWRLARVPVRRFTPTGRVECLLVLSFAVLILLPALIGGIQLSIFRGNHHDAFNYLESAITYREQPFATVTHWSPLDFIAQGLFPYARDNLAYRPEITFLYGALSSFDPAGFLRLHYVLLLYFQFLSFCGTWALASELLTGRRIISILLAAGIVGGFWGQYVLDLDAWSQSAFMPLAVCGLILLIKLAQNGTSFGRPPQAAKLELVYTVVWLGLFYLYPEGACFALPGHAACLIAGSLLFRVLIPWRRFLMWGLAFCLGMVPVFWSNVLTLRDQTGYAFTSFDWWTYYDAFLKGNGGSTDLFSNAADFVAGILGLYFVTPTSYIWPLVATLIRVLILAGSISICWLPASRVRSLPKSVVSVATYVGTSSVLVVGFCALGKYWTAGKGLSFYVYALLLLLIVPSVSRPAWRRGIIARVGAVSGYLFLGLQLLFLIYRPVAAREPFGIIYHSPYPAIQDPQLKENVNFADWSFLESLTPTERQITLQIDDLWIQCFVRMLLLSHNIPFCIEPPVFDDSSSGNVLHPPSCGQPTLRVTAEEATRAKFRFRVIAVRTESPDLKKDR
jgi:hypothetical protein